MHAALDVFCRPLPHAVATNPPLPRRTMGSWLLNVT
jgi:hypothetical protein